MNRPLLYMEANGVEYVIVSSQECNRYVSVLLDETKDSRTMHEDATNGVGNGHQREQSHSRG